MLHDHGRDVEIQWLGLLVTAECLGSILWRLKVTTTNHVIGAFRLPEPALH